MWYTIQSTDEWLSKLAGKYMGNMMDYMKIYEQNKDVLYKGPDHVEPGMTLWIPVDGKQRPSDSAPAASKDASRSGASYGPQLPAGAPKKPMDKNKIMMAGGGAMAVIALLVLMSKRK